MANYEAADQEGCDKTTQQQVGTADAKVQTVRAFADDYGQHQNAGKPDKNTGRIGDQVSDISKPRDSCQDLSGDSCAVQKFGCKDSFRAVALEEVGGVGEGLRPTPAQEWQASDPFGRHQTP